MISRERWGYRVLGEER